MAHAVGEGIQISIVEDLPPLVKRMTNGGFLTNCGKSSELEASTRGRRGRWDIASCVPVLRRAGYNCLAQMAAP